MDWLAKTIGGTEGLTLGGPLGGICGRALKTFYDANVISPAKMKALEERYYSSKLTPQEKSQLLFFLTLCSLLGKITKVDNKVSPAELDASLKIMLGPLKLSGVALKLAKIIFNKAKASSFSARSIALQYYTESDHASVNNEQFMIEALMVVAFADGKLHESEWRMIRSIGVALDVDRRQLRLAAAKYSTARDKELAILEVEPDAPRSQVRAKAKELAAVFDPKTMEKRSIPPELGKFATSRLQVVNSTFDRVKNRQAKT